MHPRWQGPSRPRSPVITFAKSPADHHVAELLLNRFPYRQLRARHFHGRQEVLSGNCHTFFHTTDANVPLDLS